MRGITVRSYLPFARGAFQSLLSYRLNFFMYVLGEFLTVFVTYYLWAAVFRDSGAASLNGFTMTDMFAYIFMCQAASVFVLNDASSEVAYEVREGSIAMNLIRPIRYRVVVLFKVLGGLIYNMVFVGIPIMLVVSLARYFSYGIAPDVMGIIGFFISCVLGFFVYFYFNFIFGLTAFFVTNVWGMGMLKGAIVNFLSGLLIPIGFFPAWAQKILSYLPFNSLIYTPVMIFLGKFRGTELINALLTQVFWVVFFGIAGTAFWRLAIKRLTILGG